MGLGQGEPDIVVIYCTRAPCLHATRRDLLSYPSMTTPDSIAHFLVSTLNPDSSLRIAAELNLSELLKDPRKSLRVPYPFFLTRHYSKESALSLAQLALSHDAESSLRQISLIRRTCA